MDRIDLSSPTAIELEQWLLLMFAPYSGRDELLPIELKDWLAKAEDNGGVVVIAAEQSSTGKAVTMRVSS